MTSKKLLKFINMYEINESVKYSMKRYKRLFFFSNWILLPPIVKQIHVLSHNSAAESPGKGPFPQEETGISQRQMSPTASLAGLILAQLCNSCGLWPTAEGQTSVKDPDYLLHALEVSVTLLGQQIKLLFRLRHLGTICSQ